MANIITLARFPLLFLYLIFLYSTSVPLQLFNIGFIFFIIFMDSLDGIVARARGEDNLLGSVLDIATDRALELVLWVAFAHKGLIPVVIPIIAIIRGTTVDAIRAIGLQTGKRAFDQIQSPVSRFIVSSKFMRSSYGLIKAIAFGLLTCDSALLVKGSQAQPTIHTLALIFSWVAISITILRGLPVLIEGVRSLHLKTEQSGNIKS